MIRIKIKEGDPVSLDDCERLWSALPGDKQFPVSYEGDSDYMKARYFGLTALAGRGSALHAGFFVGLAKIGDYVLEATPRFENLDFAQMFADCSDDPVIAQHLLARTFFVWPEEEPWIKVSPASWFAPLLVIAFLQALNELCRRHLRRNYVRVVDNLTGRVKGRIRVGEQIRQNLARARLDCNVCEYGRFDDDCLENKILRAALEVSAAFLARRRAPPLVHSWIGACRVSLARVTITPIQHFQFQGVRQTGSFRHYRRPIRFAWAVLRHLGVSPEYLSEQGEYLHVPPFALCTYELFERYAEVTLRKQHGEDVWAGYSANNLGYGRYKVRPDFLIVSESEIVDCKYKNLKTELDDNERADAYQIVSYSRHDGVLEKLRPSQERGRPSRLVLLYPKVAEDKQLWGKFGPEECDDSFEIPLVRRRLYCPRVSN